MLTLKKIDRAIKAVICAVIVGLAMPAIALADHDNGRRGRGDRDRGRFDRDFDRRDGSRRDRDDDDRRGRRIFKVKRSNHLWWENDFDRHQRQRRGSDRLQFRLFR
jgi:hypothetical protein